MRGLLFAASLALLACRPPAEPVNPEPTSRAQPDAGPPLAIVEAEPEPEPQLEPEPEPVRKFDPDPSIEPPPEPEPEPAWAGPKRVPGGVAGGVPAGMGSTGTSSGTRSPGMSGMSGPSMMTSALSKDQIRDVVKRNLKGVKACYQSGLAKNPQLEGRMMISYVIGPDGKVIEATVKSSNLADKEVATCVQKEILSWHFPKPKGGGVVRISYPFLFKSG